MQADYLFDRLLIQPPLRRASLAQTRLHRIIADMRVAMVAPMELVGCGGDVIEDMAFSGHGCAISQASTSIMIDTLKGKTVEEAKQIIDTFIGMIKREITDEAELKKLDEAIALKNVSNMPARVKCALLAWHTLEDMIEKKQ